MKEIGGPEPVATASRDSGGVLVIGSGPIVIGQAAEFDYAGTQACRALREEGVRVVLVNSNPATIMTDDAVADRVYIEPLTPESVERVIERERPEALLPTLGGQTGLNLAVALAEAGALDRWGVRLLGTPLESIRAAEDREEFRSLLIRIGEPAIEGRTVRTVEEGLRFAGEAGLPLISRPAYTLGGTGGGIARTREELAPLLERSLRASPMGQTLLERSIAGWKEIEYEVLRDGAGNTLAVCNMENLDPVGVHTGDSIVVAPSQTLSDPDYQRLRSAAFRIVSALGVEGGCNVQFALDPRSDLYYVIEVNPRVSRSSALASKATGYPIARVAAKIALGRNLDQIPNGMIPQATAALEPALDYCVVKLPRWPFDKFTAGDRGIGTQMKATGEVMALDRTFGAALSKAVRSLELGGRTLAWEDPRWAGHDALLEAVAAPTDTRLWALLAALRRGVPVAEVAERSGVDPWFLHELLDITQLEARLAEGGLEPDALRTAKRAGFSDAHIGALTGGEEEAVRARRQALDLRPVWKTVDTCAAEWEATAPYYYSTYEEENEALPLGGRASLVLGSGPIRIGQGIEFDYCSVHSARALREAGVGSIMVNSNPETVSTDYDSSDRLYFDPLDAESVRDILENERLHTLGESVPVQESFDGRERPVAGPPAIVQFGGQTAINLAASLHDAGFRVLGSSLDALDLAEDRERFDGLLARLGLRRPPGASARGYAEALEVAQRVGYPLLVRPSYVLGGRAMRIVHDERELAQYLRAATDTSGSRPLLLDRYIEGREVEVDAVCDGERVLIPGIVEHIERAGVHSGDSFGVYPPVDLTPDEARQVEEMTVALGLGLGVRGIMNVQYVARDGLVYVLEVNPRASRTVPFISKVTGVPLVSLATRVMLGETLAELGYEGGLLPDRPLWAVKAPVFSMSKLIGVDAALGPEMKSTGEVMGVDFRLEPALSKAMLAAGMGLPPGGLVLLSIADRDKAHAVSLARAFAAEGHALAATPGTSTYLESQGVRVAQVVHKIGPVRPDITDVIRRRQVCAVVNTVSRNGKAMRDGYEIRRAAVESGVPCLTSLDTARALARALGSSGDHSVATVAEYRAGVAGVADPLAVGASPGRPPTSLRPRPEGVA
jgi:carbamoyl-phosphate synthase large subunit